MKKYSISSEQMSMKCVFLAIFLLIVGLVTGQRSDTNIYIPQITLTAEPGFGPYVAGTHQLSTVEISDLPLHTSKVMFRFIDVDGNQVGDAQVRTGTDITVDVYQLWLDDLDLPLSPQLHVELTYQGDSIADYYVAFTVYPDTLSIQASAGWGPFITNNYPRVTGWNPVPDLYNTFSASNLPPRTEEVDFAILAADSSVIHSYQVTAPTGQYLETAVYSNVMMSNLPLNTQTLQILVFCNGGPDQGLIYHKPLTTVMQKPQLTTKSGGTTLTDSVGIVIHNPVNGQALFVDSVRYASITNGPGIKNASAPHYYQGPYSMDIMAGSFTIEGWIKIDGVKLVAHPDKSMSFMRVDSLFDIAIFNEDGLTPALRFSSLLGGNLLEMYYIEMGNQLFQENAWHHFAFVTGDPLQWALFYFDGTLLGSISNEDNLTYIENHYNVNNYLKTNPLILGGCNGQKNKITADYSFVTAMDEIRIWNRYLTHNEILQNLNKSILQDTHLTGYWDFDDYRNHLNYISDESFNNNSGELKNGATFIPENPDLFTVMDTIILKTSNQQTDSIKFTLMDENNQAIDSIRVKAQNNQAEWQFDVSALPYTVSRLRINEHCPAGPKGGFESEYNIRVLAPYPIATPMCNWGTYYQSDTHVGDLTNSIFVNGFPANTTKVELGLKNGSTVYNNDVFTLNSIPYQYCLTLNGTDNYIKTSHTVSSASNYEISLWFKTTTTQGGMMIGLCDNPDGIPVNTLDRKLVMRKDGSIYYSLDTGGPTDTLFGANKYNDGLWHCVTVSIAPPSGGSLSVDGCVVDNIFSSSTINYNGWWVIGRHHISTGNIEYAEFFQGSLAYINIWYAGKEKDAPVDYALLNGAHRGNLLFKLDEGGGTVVHDTQGTNNGTLMGSTPNWTKLSNVSAVIWQHNMIDKPAGEYTFYAKVYYPGGGEAGVYYPLGIYNILDPLPGHSFSYYLLDGVGYFNEAVTLINWLNFSTDYTGQGNTGWVSNVMRYVFMSPDHRIIDQNQLTWTTNGNNLSISIDMGDAPPGSYLDIGIGYKTSSQTVIIKDFPVPILVRRMLAPTISGDFGPFIQAVAPGTMKHLNTFTITTGEYSDLTKMTATFFDTQGNEIASANGVKINNTTWHITQDMSLLSPPESIMKISYYLGVNYFLALVAGPYKIPINKTRPGWFDFIGNSAFSNIKEYSDSVTFQITTPFESSYVINNSIEVEVPDWVPLIGGTSSSIDMPGANAYLKYIKSESKLKLDEPPEFFQKYVNLGAGNPSIISLGFNHSQNNSYELDQYDNLIATQNFSMGGNVTSGFEKMESIVKKIQELIKFISDADPESVIVKPTFSVGYTGSFEYSSRLRLMVDTVTGKWGSYGNLDVDANPDHENAYKNSSSYHFSSGALGVEFSVGMAVFEGLASGNFGIDGRIVLGFGHSYVTIPAYKDQLLKSLAFQTYARFYVDLLWGWYEHTLWGPRMIYTHNFWNDDLSDVFPPTGKSELVADLPSGLSSGSDLVRSFHPVSTYSRMPLPKPQSTLLSSDNMLLFNWLEKGESYGQRNLSNRYLDLTSRKFSDKKTIETNYHALNSPVSDKNQDGVTILAWAQSRHSNETFALTVDTTNQLEEFFRSQDIYFSVYDAENDSILQSGMLEDQMLTVNDGRAEGNAEVTMLSDSRALITWQVVDPEIPQADIWYVFLDNNGTQWEQSIQGVAASGEGVETQVKRASPEEGKAVLVWMNTSRDELPTSTVMSSYFDGSQWTQPVLVSSPGDNICNYIDLEFQNELGALVYTVFVEDPMNGNHEKLKLIPWKSDHFDTTDIIELFVDSTNHVQLPSIALKDDGKVAVAVKTERMAPKEENMKISQVDIFKGNLNDLKAPWTHIPAHPFVCDTNKQVSELSLAFAGNDTLISLSQEYPMFAVNASFEPQNGIIFGDPYMNLVLRSFAFDEEGAIEDVDESEYFLGISEPESNPDDFTLVQCYPNPCTNQTTLRFGLRKASGVKIELFDIHGILQADLIGQHLNAGLYELEINTAQLEAGSYIFRLQTKDTARSIKLIVSR